MSPATQSVRLGQRTDDGRYDRVRAPGELIGGEQLDRVRDVQHLAARHREQPGLLDGFIGERRGRNADGRDPPAFQVNEVAHTARRTGASIG